MDREKEMVKLINAFLQLSVPNGSVVLKVGSTMFQLQQFGGMIKKCE
jgi:hypothetical protein